MFSEKRFVKKRIKGDCDFRSMNPVISTWAFLIALTWVIQVRLDKIPPPSLDQMHCLKQSSFQLSKRASMVRRVNYDLTGLLTLLLKLREEFVSLGISVYENEPQLIQVNSLSRALLLGRRLPWTSCNASLLLALSPDHRLILDFVRVVADSDEEQGLCLIGSIEVSYPLCVDSLKSSINNLRKDIVLREPDPTVPDDKLGVSEVLVGNRNSLAWVEPDSTETYRYLIARDHVSDLVLNLQSLVNRQIEQTVSALDIFSKYVENIQGCNYFLHTALKQLHKMKMEIGDELSETDLSEIETECRKATLDLLGKKRSSRGLLSWLFSDQGETISRLITAQHQAVKADEILLKNQQRVQTANIVLAKNLLLLKEIETNNSEVLRSMLAMTQTRETLHHVEHLLKEEKLAITSMLRGVGNQVSIIAGEFKGLMKRLVDDLSPQPQCSLDNNGRGIACSQESSFVDSVNEGILYLASGADLYQSSQIFLVHCLFLPEAYFGSRVLFKGNRGGFLRADGYYHNKNLSTPEQCFEDPKSTDYRCNKFTSQYYDGGEVKPPLNYGPINFVIGKDFAYIQSKSGTILVNSKHGQSFPLGNTPLLIMRDDFPIFADSQKILYGDLSIDEDVSAETEFFIENVDASTFDFKLPVMKLPKMSNMGDWALFVEETEELFSTSSVFQALSISSIVVACGFLGCLTFGIYLCCRKREENPALFQKVYERFRGGEKTGPDPGPKPSSSSVRHSNRNQEPSWWARMARRKEKIEKMNEESERDEILLQSTSST